MTTGLALLARCGQALYGPLWQTPLAQALAVNDRTVRRWASGASPIPAAVWPELYELLADRRGDLHSLMAELPSAA